jgi:cell division protein FtsW
MGRKLAFDRTLFVAVIVLTLFGVLMVYSASSIWALEHKGSSYHYLKRQVTWSLLGLGVLILTMSVDYRKLQQKWAVYGLYLTSLVLLLWALASPPVNGAHRWIWLGPLSFQPSELAKVSLVVLLAYQLAKRRDRINDLAQCFGPCLFLAGPLIFLTNIQPDLGASAVMVLLFGVMFFVAGLQMKKVFAIGAIATVLLCALVFTHEYRLERVRSYFDPGADTDGAGFQMQQAKFAISSGGLAGRSLGDSRQKLLWLPLPHTDFIYAVIGEELGLLGCVGVLAAFLVVFWRGMRASLYIRDSFGMYLGVGLTVFLVGQGLINMSVVLGLLPTKGLSLPFISYGGSSLLVSLGVAGVLLNLSQYSN